MEAVKVNAMENREVLCNRKKNLASQESFFSCVQNLQIALLAIMLQQGKDLAFFRNRETSKGGLQLLGLLMKTEFFNMRSCCNPMHFKTTFKNSRRSLFYQDFIFQLFELWLLLHIHHVLLLFHILIRQCTFSRPTVCNNQAHDIIMDQPQTNFSLPSLPIIFLAELSDVVWLQRKNICCENSLTKNAYVKKHGNVCGYLDEKFECRQP